jgi:hypothetical protein
VDEIYQSLGHQLGLVFRFKEEQVEKVSSTLTPAMLAGLDDSLKSQLREALDVLDGEQLSTVIQRIGEKDQALAKLLKKFAGNFDYPTIMMALKKSTEDIQDT